MPRQPASLWDYVSVMYRDRKEHLDPHEWPLRTRWLHDPRHLVHDIRHGQWRHLAVMDRAVLALGAVLFLAAMVGLIGVVLSVFTDFAPLFSVGGRDVSPLWVGLILLMVPMSGWPVVWAAWIATGGSDRATAPLRRRRTRIAHAPRRGIDSPAIEIASRRIYWRHEIACWPNGRFNWHRQWVDPDFTLLHLVLVTPFIAVMLFNAFTPSSWFTFSMAAVVFGSLFWGQRRCKAVRKRLLDALDAAACPDCAYSLLGLPGRPADAELLIWPGPRRCPECGSPWPALPPPVPTPAAR